MIAGTAWSRVHDENSYASGQKKRPRGPRSTHTGSEKIASFPDPVLHRPLVDLRTKALIYFSHHHLQTVNGTLSVLKGVTTDFLLVWKSKTECSILDLAVSSVALAVYSRTQQHPPAAVEASTRYHQLLRLQRIEIPSLDNSNIDTCLIAIFFMGRFEDVVHSPNYPNVQAQPVRKLHSFSHHDGALAILKYWKHHMCHSYPATDIIKYTRRGMIRSATLRNLGLPEWMREGSSFGEHGSELGYDSIAVQIVNIRHRLLVLLKNKNSGLLTSHQLTLASNELHNETRDLDTALQDWADHYLEGYQRNNVPDSYSFPRKYFYSSVAYSYSSSVQASVWILYHATRLLINSTLLRILNLMDANSNAVSHERRIECLCVMEATANDLASNLPFSLQRFTVTEGPEFASQSQSITINEDDDVKPFVANMIIWPLSLAANLSCLDIKYKLWFRSLLTCLGRITGISLLESAETSSWPEL
jgi:hypothetical protein